MVGFSFSKKLELPGIGEGNDLIRNMPNLLALGAVMTALSYFLFDRYFYAISPYSYPTDALYLVCYPFKAALSEEVILRFCMVTLAVGISKSKPVGVFLVSAVAAIFTIKYFHFMGIGFGFNYLSITQIFLSFSANLLLGYLFVTRGLMYSMTLKFIFGFKYAAVSWLMG
jgi:hypothetical protein